LENRRKSRTGCWSEQDLNFQPRFSSARRQPNVPHCDFVTGLVSSQSKSLDIDVFRTTTIRQPGRELTLGSARGYVSREWKSKRKSRIKQGTMSNRVKVSGLILALVILLMADTSAAAESSATAAPVTLAVEGPARQLPTSMCGSSSEPMIERLIGDNAKAAALKELLPAWLRFPGGSQSNFYDWKSGLLDFHADPTSSPYIKFWDGVAKKIALTFPGGVHFEEFAKFARELGADPILVANLETSTLEGQKQWFQQLKSEGIAPDSIELGNEFWIAMAFDPASMQRWPDETSSMEEMHKYEQALRPLAAAGAKFAVQASGHTFWLTPGAAGPIARRLLNWDESLHSESWFDAVTIHLYPLVDQMQRYPGGNTADGLFRYLMSRCDAGVDRTIRDIASRVPGKEIWITEWAPHGGNSWATGNPVTPAMTAQAVAREMLAFMRHPEVTRELFFTLNFEVPPQYGHFVKVPDGSYRPMAEAQILGWFDRAANEGATFRRVVEKGAAPISPAADPMRDSYREIEGGVFNNTSGTTLILQNAAAHARALDATDGGRLSNPSSIEIIGGDDLSDTGRRPVQIKSASADKPIVIPAYSVVRIIWPGRAEVVK